MNTKYGECSYCGEQFNLKDLLKFTNDAGETHFICSDCKEHTTLKSAKDIIAEFKSNILTPAQMTEKIQEYVIGQEDTIKTLSVEFYKHFLRITNTKKKRIAKKNNILLVGPTASGKSYIVEQFANILNLPFAKIDITSMSPVGYSGGDVSTVFNKLISIAGNVFKAERGIVFIDEIDKITETQTHDGVDVRGKMLQQSLLTMLEGNDIELTNQLFPGVKSKTYIKTNNILFVCAGAFVGIEKVIKSRLKVGEKFIGFNSPSIKNTSNIEADLKNDNYYRHLLSDVDLIDFGFIPEIVGRLPVISTLDKLSTKDIENILFTQNGIIMEYEELLKTINPDFKLKFDKPAVKLIADTVYKSKIGVRSLRGIIARITNDIFYNLSDNPQEFIVTKEYVEFILNSKQSNENTVSTQNATF